MVQAVWWRPALLDFDHQPSMRSRRVGVTSGIVHPRLPWPRRSLVQAGVLVVAIAVAWAFGQEAWAAHQLQAQAADLRARNAYLETQNNDYRRDIGAVQSGAAGEEVARENGYSKPGEKIYVIGSPPAPTPAPAPVVRNTSSPGPLTGLGEFLRGLVGRAHPSR